MMRGYRIEKGEWLLLFVRVARMAMRESGLCHVQEKAEGSRKENRPRKENYKGRSKQRYELLEGLLCFTVTLSK
jgi:hypothetical protein